MHQFDSSIHAACCCQQTITHLIYKNVPSVNNNIYFISLSAKTYYSSAATTR